MKTIRENPNLDGVAHVVDGRTGRVVAPQDYKQHQRDRMKTRLCRRFVRGPIPLGWLAKAFALTPSAMKCAAALYYQRGLCRNTRFKVEPARFRELGINGTARHRGLNELAKAGLIEVEQCPGQCPFVTIIEDKSEIEHE
ncbi:MAG: hypothetical protein KDM63_03375 [Verrucomicrobiae bacterium]|nr:hypothetical protein [Verrucomicrobiae bacterium]